MKTKEELNALNEDYTELNEKLAELTEDDLRQVAGGMKIIDTRDRKCPFCGQKFQYQYFFHHVMECAKKHSRRG